MAKQGMKRPEVTHTKPKNEQSPVPEIQGKAKHGKEKARPIIAGTENNDLKVWHTEKPISNAYPLTDTDLGRDNSENDMSFADKNDV